MPDGDKLLIRSKISKIYISTKINAYEVKMDLGAILAMHLNPFLLENFKFSAWLFLS
jgi:hypothetical protein